MITFDEPIAEDLGEKIFSTASAINDKGSSQQQAAFTPQFKQLEPLKMIKRDLSKEFLLPSSPSTSSADTVINAQGHEKRLGSSVDV